MKKTALFILLVLVTTLPVVAWAKDYKFMPSVDGGGIWFFLYDNNAKSIIVDPSTAYGATIVQGVDFEWARNMAFEISYQHSKSRGEWNPFDEEAFLFDLTCDYATANIGYFFIGRRIHPYIAGGFGTAVVKFERLNQDKIWETDLAINGGAGADFTLWEPRGAAEQINIGGRVRYIYIMPHKIVDSGMNALAVTARFQVRF